MKFAVLGTDGRFEFLKKLLISEGHELTDRTESADIAVTKWPPESEIMCENIVACGPQPAPDGVCDLLKDEEYQQKIADMTAEGAIAAAMGRTGCMLKGADCMVIGWGRIGRALAVRLQALGANVTVLTRRKEARAEISGCGYNAANTDRAAELIRSMRFVFSTAPAMVIDRNALRRARRDAAIIDLASPPYGVDMDAAEEFFVNARREPGVPGRYCPENAGEAIYGSMVKRGMTDERT